MDKKVCCFILDLWSCKNVHEKVLQNWTETTWTVQFSLIKKGTKVVVDKQSLVKYSIGLMYMIKVWILGLPFLVIGKWYYYQIRWRSLAPQLRRMVSYWHRGVLKENWSSELLPYPLAMNQREADSGGFVEFEPIISFKTCWQKITCPLMNMVS